MDDHELLREYVERQSEQAFAELVARHVDFVYATAWRVMGDSAAAQDVAQAVFIHLARKAWTVRDGRALVGWLYRATYRTALDTRRGEQRRRQRETDAMILTEQNSSSPAAWEKLAPLLDEALQQLSRAEQNAVLLRYFEGKTLRETGAALGATEDAAQMRVSRALDKMRTHFARQGVTVATGALAVALSANTAKAAPAGLAPRVTGTSLAGANGAGVGGAMLKILFMSTKTKAVLAVAIIAIITMVGLGLWWFTRPMEAPPEKTAEAAIPAKADAPNQTAPPSIIPPVAPPTATPTQVPQPVATKPATDRTQMELNAMIDDMAAMVRSGDLSGMELKYTPPAERPSGIPPGREALAQAVQQEQQARQADPRMQPIFEAQAQAMESLKGQQPVMNAAGDQATYQMAVSAITFPDGTSYPAHTGPAVFIKINGKWYIADRTGPPPP
jgi:RNA polymerase sigma factor (sigma-70 family)